MSGIPSLSSSGSSASGIPVKDQPSFIYMLDFDFFTIIVIVQINGVINPVRIRVTGLDINILFSLKKRIVCDPLEIWQ